MDSFSEKVSFGEELRVEVRTGGGGGEECHKSIIGILLCHIRSSDLGSSFKERPTMNLKSFLWYGTTNFVTLGYRT